jgi:hypothetical protein
MQIKVALDWPFSHERSFVSSLSKVNCRQQLASSGHRDEVSLAIFPCLGHVECRMTGVTRACALGLAAAPSSHISTPFPATSLPPSATNLSTHTTILTHSCHPYPSLPHQTLSHTHTHHPPTMTGGPANLGNTILGKGKGRANATTADMVNNKQDNNQHSRAQPGETTR